jgi:hypothetical protein
MNSRNFVLALVGIQVRSVYAAVTSGDAPDWSQFYKSAQQYGMTCGYVAAIV